MPPPHRTAARVAPANPILHHRFGLFLEEAQRTNEALIEVREAIRIAPNAPDPHGTLGRMFARRGDFSGAMAEFRTALDLDPGRPAAHNDLGRILATHPAVKMRNGTEAVRHGLQACSLSAGQNPEYLDSLGLAFAESGQSDKAVETEEAALRLARKVGRPKLEHRISRHLENLRERRTLEFNPAEEWSERR